MLNKVPVMPAICPDLLAAVASAIQAPTFQSRSYLQRKRPAERGQFACLLVQVKHATRQGRLQFRYIAAVDVCLMDDEKQPFRPPAVQIAVSRTPVESPDRSLLRVFPKWLKVAKLWFQRETILLRHA